MPGHQFIFRAETGIRIFIFYIIADQAFHFRFLYIPDGCNVFQHTQEIAVIWIFDVRMSTRIAGYVLIRT